jgi:hypothetical protein
MPRPPIADERPEVAVPNIGFAAMVIGWTVVALVALLVGT